MQKQRVLRSIERLERWWELGYETMLEGELDYLIDLLGGCFECKL